MDAVGIVSLHAYLMFKTTEKVKQMQKTEKNYTIMQNGKKLISLDSIEIAREGLEYYGSTSYIKYNVPGIKSYEAAKQWEKEHAHH